MSKSTIERFLEKIEINPDTDCWEWISALSEKGYGLLWENGKPISAHRFSFEYFKGQISGDMVIDHRCRNHKCVNPDHLDMVTNKVNVLRGEGLTVQHAKATHCPHGHPYDLENTYYSSRGWRACKKCIQERNNKRPRKKLS